MEEDRNRYVHIAQQYKMRFYENEFPHEGELVMVSFNALRVNPRNPKRMAATSPCLSITVETA
jgi:hypothetical protein